MRNNEVVQAVAITREDSRKAVQGKAEELSALKGNTLVVTGGTGFIGSWIAELIACLNDEYSFRTNLVLIARGTDQFKATRAHLANRSDVKLVKSDIRHALEVPKETEWVIHAASNPDNRFHTSNPIESMMVIADGTASVLRAVDRCSNLKMFLNLSSGLVYGSQPSDMERISESFRGGPECGAITSAYAEAKRYAETLCSAARSQARIPTATARPFAFVGPYQSLDGPWAVNNFMRDALAGQSIRVLGDGQTVRSYLYGSDAAFWILKMLTNARAGQAYNLGSPNGITLEKLADLVASFFSPRPEIHLRVGLGLMGSAANQRSRFVPDTTLAAENLGVGVSVSLEEALKRTIGWHKALQV